ncbi:MAG TPA: serine/threonine-protein kinase [Candidatus Obscuribacterales bacterium]
MDETCQVSPELEGEKDARRAQKQAPDSTASDIRLQTRTIGDDGLAEIVTREADEEMQLPSEPPAYGLPDETSAVCLAQSTAQVSELAAGGANAGGANTAGASAAGANAGGASAAGANTGGASAAGANTGGADTAGANTASANAGGANAGGANTGGADTAGANTASANAASLPANTGGRFNISKKRSPKSSFANATEVLLQYGNLQTEIMHFRQTLLQNRKYQTDSSLLAFLLLLSPFIILDWIFSFLRMTNPQLLLHWGYSLLMSPDRYIPLTDEYVLTHVRSLWYAVGGGLVMLGFLSYALIHILRSSQSGLFHPSHLGIGCDGIRSHHRYPFVQFSGKLMAWKDMRSVLLTKQRAKNGQIMKSLEITNSARDRMKLDLRRFRREQDREFFGRAVKLYVGKLAEDIDIREIMLLEDFDPSYTKLWTQSLLTPPTRERYTTLEPGTELADGRFRIIERIGGGGQGTAYLAESHIDEAFAERVTRVVLKEYVLPEAKNMYDRRRALKKLEHEVALLGRLSHVGIAAFLDVFVEDHRAYLVTEYVEGHSLRQLVTERGPLDTKKALGIALQMCDILTYLHSLKPPVVHQDFTPENLILSHNGDLKIVDFNVAKESITIKTGLVVGKQAYMPPEQFKGKATPQSDIYALGGTLYFLLTGKDPEPLTAARLSRALPDVSEAVDELLLKATALDLESRFDDAAQLKAAIEQIIEPIIDGGAHVVCAPEAAAAPERKGGDD